MQTPSFVFFGTPDLAVTILDELKTSGLTPKLIVTAPDRRSGRGMKVTPPPVKIWADEHHVPTLQPEKLDEQFVAKLKEDEWDVFVVFAYSAILKPEVFTIPKYGSINLHPSLLPKLRGPSPIVSAILTDQKETGVSVIRIDGRMDHGPILAQEAVTPTTWPPYVSDLEAQLVHVGGKLLADVLVKLPKGEIEPQEQEHGEASFCHMLQKEDGRIDLADDPYRNLLKIRAYANWPGAYFFTEKNRRAIRVKVVSAHIENTKLILDEVIPEGKKRMSYEDFFAS